MKPLQVYKTYMACDNGTFTGESGFEAVGFWRATVTMDK